MSEKTPQEQQPGFISTARGGSAWVEEYRKAAEEYGGELSATASHRTFLDIETNLSVRPQFGKSDYYTFREGERPPTEQKRQINRCMTAYTHVGIIKNVIDLMSDFSVQGVKLIHPNKRIQRFYRRWFQKVHGTDRSERFLNNLFRCGNVIVKREMSKISVRDFKNMAKANEFKEARRTKKEIPFRYDFLNPLTVNVLGGKAASFGGPKTYTLTISRSIKQMAEKNPEFRKGLPKAIIDAINKGHDEVILDNDQIGVFHYKKDDWQLWAEPMIQPIMDDISMLEKMKLADMAALDGAISNIRLWSLGSLEHEIMPNAAMINRLRNILASNVGGGVMDLVWGPELKMTESNTQIYKFLGTEKYEPVLNNIYAGLGIPPTLTGLASNGGGFTNNFVSLKTLTERLEYGRSILKEFWDEELRLVQKAMGFRKPAHVHFDNISLSDEAAERDLWIQLADRDLISTETVLERFGELPEIERIRTTQENKMRDKGRMAPKTSPYHNPQVKEGFQDTALKNGLVGIKDLIPEQSDEHKPELPEPTGPGGDNGGGTKKKKEVKDNGRPKNSRDTKKRKQKEVKPRSKADFDPAMFVWATKARKQISDLMAPAMLNYYGKKSLRSLTKAQTREVENVNLRALAAHLPFSEVTDVSLAVSLDDSTTKDKYLELKAVYEDLVEDFRAKSGSEPTVDDLRDIQCTAYVICQ